MNAISRNSRLRFNQDDAKERKANANFQSISSKVKQDKAVKNQRGMNFEQQKNRMEPFD